MLEFSIDFNWEINLSFKKIIEFKKLLKLIIFFGQSKKVDLNIHKLNIQKDLLF